MDVEDYGIEIEVGRFPEQRKGGWLKIKRAFLRNADQETRNYEAKKRLEKLWKGKDEEK